MKNSLRIFLLLAAAVSTSVCAQSAHYLDCDNGNDGLDSRSPQTAWKTLAHVNEFTFQPGDSLLLKRGSTCTGMLSPRGSGSEDDPVRLDAYGKGVLPKIIGTGQQAGIKLNDQQYWEITHLDVTGGSPYGIFITGSVPHLKHFRITDVVVHDVTGQPKTKQTGLVVIGSDEKAPTIFDDIVIDGVTAYNTTQWAGIIVIGGVYAAPGSPRGNDITIRNSIVHDVAGDGILLSLAKNGLIERNVSWNTGMQQTESIGTPNAIWEWECDDCTVQYNEGFFSDSPGVDGGVFDIDWGCHNNIVQYNFAHDSQGYCASVFGAGGSPGSSTHSIIRRNLCLNNGRSPRLAQRQGAIYLSTWDNGHLGDVQIYNNTILWDPPPDAPALVSDAEIDPASPRIFSNNLIISRSPLLVRSTSSLQLDRNQYRLIGDAAPAWQYGSQTYTSLAALQSGAGQEKEGTLQNPGLNELLQPTVEPSCSTPVLSIPDLYGSRAPAGHCVIGAFDPVLPGNKPAKPLGKLSLHLGGDAYKPEGWTLLAVLTPQDCSGAATSRSQLVVLQSMLRQFATLGLHVDVIPNQTLEAKDADNWAADWNFEKIRLLPNAKPGETHSAFGITSPIGMILISPDGNMVQRWNAPLEAPQLELTLRSLLGVPEGMQTEHR
jgi:hypothetical protein